MFYACIPLDSVCIFFYLANITNLVKLFASDLTTGRLSKLFQVLLVDNICIQRNQRKTKEEFIEVCLKKWYQGKKVTVDAVGFEYALSTRCQQFNIYLL